MEVISKHTITTVAQIHAQARPDTSVAHRRAMIQMLRDLAVSDESLRNCRLVLPLPKKRLQLITTKIHRQRKRTTKNDKAYRPTISKGQLSGSCNSRLNYIAKLIRNLTQTPIPNASPRHKR